MTEALRSALVETLVSTGRLHDARVREAVLAVPRHLFLPGLDPAAAYADEAIPTRWSADGRPTSSSSQPAIVVAMLEQLDVRPGLRVLEIGSGTGWNAALLAHLTGPDGQVSTVDIQPEVAEQARANLAAAGATGVRLLLGDGAAGDPQGAPYDRIELTAAARDLAPAWVEQLAPDGRIVLPLSLNGAQVSVALQKQDDHLVSVSVVDAGFMPLQGTLAGVDPVHPLGGRGVMLQLERPGPVDTDALLAALSAAGDTVAVPVTRRESLTGLRLWLALREPDAGALAIVREDRWVPPMPALAGTDSLAVLVPLEDGTGVRAYGPEGAGLAVRLRAEVDAWIAAGRPMTDRLRIAAYPAGSAVPGPAIERDHTLFVATWAGREA